MIIVEKRYKPVNGNESQFRLAAVISMNVEGIFVRNMTVRVALCTNQKNDGNEKRSKHFANGIFEKGYLL